MKFTLCVPAYNEEDIIVRTISELYDVLIHLPTDIEWKIIIADNGSTDKTREKVFALRYDQVLIMSTSEKGKGIAIRGAVKNLDADLFGFIDADLSADPKIIPEMLRLLIENEEDLVVGSRFYNKILVNRSLWRNASSRIFNLLQSLILGVRVRDTQCGLKIMNKKGIIVLNECKEKSWFLDLELLARAEQKKLKIKEIPVKWEEFKYKDRISKLRVLRDGFSAIIAMFRIRIRLNKL